MHLLWPVRKLPRPLSGSAKRPSLPLTEGTLVSQTSSCSSPLVRINLPASLQWSCDTLPIHVFVDSGADDNFIDSSLVKQSLIPVEALIIPKTVNTLDGRWLAVITQRTVPVTLIISGNHRESIQLFIIPSPCSLVVLGLPWIQLHNPHMDWSAATISSWSPFCHTHCFHSAVSTDKIKALSVPKPLDLFLVPPVYHDMAQVFCKEQALSLPLHCPYDYGIDLLPGHRSHPATSTICQAPEGVHGGLYQQFQGLGPHLFLLISPRSRIPLYEKERFHTKTLHQLSRIE